MTAHQMRTRYNDGDATITAECSCGDWTGIRDATGKAGSLTRLHAEHQRTAAAAEIDLRKAAALAWYVRTGHCVCGNPGTYCTCTSPCPCAELHPVGSGLAADALTQFAATTVGDDQPELFS